MIKISDIQTFREKIGTEKPTVVVFKTEWCPDCRFIEPFIPELTELYKERFSFFQIDRDELPDLSEEYQIMGIPSFIVFKSGEEKSRYVNKLKKTRAEIEAFLDEASAICSKEAH
ncbi:thiol-disulfide isomerase [Paenibacillus beijingensis]|uniref:Thiol-disulfide isomerase n=2 Tax=Paenibacillus beijingensis TaxID=1126833 RepID=A0A0D5NMS6_9BACL|nr:thiol-disulfide isomerase [Paenibacillus beijingensis]